MDIYVDYVYRAGELYANEDMTGFIGLEDSAAASVLPRGKMILRMFTSLPFARIKSFLHFAKQVGRSNERYAKLRHIDALMVCVDQAHQGQGIASELIRFAKEKADETGVPLLFDTDMEVYAQMYRHLGCELYNTVTADNGVTRYSLCYKKRAMFCRKTISCLPYGTDLEECDSLFPQFVIRVCKRGYLPLR
jgi:GNAT superfamily N-acetyltransferase